MIESADNIKQRRAGFDAITSRCVYTALIYHAGLLDINNGLSEATQIDSNDNTSDLETSDDESNHNYR